MISRFYFIDIEITTTEAPEIDPISFEWSSTVLDRNSDNVPDLHITFTDGSSDKIVLNRHNAVDMSQSAMDPCSFMGHLESEPESVVAVTGCPNEEQYHVTLTSMNRDDVTLKVNSKGQSHRVRDLVSNEVDGVHTSQSLHQQNEKIEESIANRAIPSQF